MRPSTQGKKATASDMMSLQRVLRRAEENSTRPKSDNAALIEHVSEAIRILLKDSSQGRQPVRKAG